MELPIEVLGLVFLFTITLSVIGAWKKIPFAMVIGGILITFIFILTDSITALGDTNTCVTDIAQDTTTCTVSPYVLDMWVRIVFMLFGTILMIGGALTWKAIKED